MNIHPSQVAWWWCGLDTEVCRDRGRSCVVDVEGHEVGRARRERLLRARNGNARSHVARQVNRQALAAGLGGKLEWRSETRRSRRAAARRAPRARRAGGKQNQAPPIRAFAFLCVCSYSCHSRQQRCTKANISQNDSKRKYVATDEKLDSVSRSPDNYRERVVASFRHDDLQPIVIPLYGPSWSDSSPSRILGTSPTMHCVLGLSCPGHAAHSPESSMCTSPDGWTYPRPMPGTIGMGSSLLLICVTDVDRASM